jgi:hypothetical protein
VTSPSEARVPHDPVVDLRNAAAWIVADSQNANHPLADRLEAWADDMEWGDAFPDDPTWADNPAPMERLTPLEAAVLDAAKAWAMGLALPDRLIDAVRALQEATDAET